MTPNTNKTRLTALVIVIVLVTTGLIFWSLLSGSKSKPVMSVLKVSSSFQNAVGYDDNSAIVEVAGQGLARFNLLNGDSKSIMSNAGDTSLDNIDSLSISANKQLFLFHASNISDSSPLGRVVKSEGLSITGNYWATYSLGTGNYSLLKVGTLLAKFKNNDVIGLSFGDSGQSLTTYVGSNLEATNSFNVSNCADFYALQNGFMILTSDNHLVFTTNGTVSQEVGDATSIVGATNNPEQLVVTQNLKNGGQRLVAINVTTGATKQIIDSVAGTGAWHSPSTVLYSVTGSNEQPAALELYNLTSNKRVRLGFSSDYTILNQASPVRLLSEHTAVISTNAKSTYLVSTDKHLANSLSSL